MGPVDLYCYGCGAWIRGQSDSAQFEDWVCCNRPAWVPQEVRARTKANWKRAARKWSLVWNALKCLRPHLLERAVECKYAPGGRGAIRARDEFDAIASRPAKYQRSEEGGCDKE
jgi:hypothetical protein